MVSLACLLLFVTRCTVHGTRVNGNIGSAAGSEQRTDAVDKFALSESHIKNLCSDETVQDACAALGASRDPVAQASIEQLAEILVVHESEAVSFVQGLGLSLNGASFSCRSLCEAAVQRIPEVLHVAAPKTRNLGCIDDACDEDAVDLSKDALLSGGLSSPPPPPSHADNNRSLPPDGNHILDVEPEVRRQMLFRTTLNVIFGIFPSPDEIDDSTGVASLLESPGDTVRFGPSTLPQRHYLYSRYLLQASAWIATALRRLPRGSSAVRKWFILHTSKEVSLQTNVARRHLTKMLQALNHLMIVKGKVHECRTSGDSGTMAFVMASVNCNVYSTHDCGQKTRYDGRYIVNICEFYWRSYWDQSERVGTLVHESSHHFGTDDNAYCDSSPTSCFRLSSDKAKNNADTYTKLVEELVAMDDLANGVQTTTTVAITDAGSHATIYASLALFGFVAFCCCACCGFAVYAFSSTSSQSVLKSNQPGFEIPIPQDVAPGKPFQFIHPSSHKLIQALAPRDGSRVLRISA